MDFELKKNIVYKTVSGVSLMLDLYIPNGAKALLPCVLWFHGGGWKEGGKEDIGSMPFLPNNLLEHGFIVASAQYRLTGVNGGGFSQSVEDCRDAAVYLKELDCTDDSRFFAGGISAGAYMALEIAMLYPSLQIRGVLSFSGIYYMRGNDEVFAPLFVPPTTKAFAENFLDASEKKAGTEANPADLLKNKNNTKFLVVHGDCDECANVLCADAFVERAKTLGRDVCYIKIKNSNHTYSPVGAPLCPPLKDVMKTAVDTVLNM